MKRMITGLLALCMVLTMFAGCAAQPQTPETTAQSAAPAPAPEVVPTVAAQEAPAALPAPLGSIPARRPF